MYLLVKMIKFAHSSINLCKATLNTTITKKDEEFLKLILQLVNLEKKLKKQEKKLQNLEKWKKKLN